MSEKKLPKGFTCECKMRHFFSAYVYAHWDVPLTHYCDPDKQGCGRRHMIQHGRATEEVRNVQHRKG